MVDYIKQLSDVLSENNIKQYQGKRKILNRDIESLVREVKNAFDSAQTDMENVISNNSLGISVSDFFNAVDDVVNENRITDPDKPTKLRDVQAFLNDVVDAFKESQDVANSIRNQAGLSTNEDFIETLDDLVSDLNLSDVDEKAQIRELKTAFQAVVDSFKTDTSTPGGNALETSADEILGASFGPGTLYDPANWNSLVHYYPLNGDATDAVGSLDLNEVNSPSYVSGIDGQGVSLNGTDQELTNDVASLSPTSAITVACWFNLAGTSQLNSLFNHITDAGGSPSFAIGVESDATFSCYLNVDGSVINTKPVGTASPETAYFVAFTYDGSTITSYRNGNNNKSTNSATGDITYSGDQLNIGHEPNAGTFANANYVDECLIFDTALDGTEIQSLYDAGV